MKNIKLCLAFMISLVALGCQPEVTREVIRDSSPTSSPNNMDSPQGGVDDGGGGNGVNNKPLEAYAKRLQDVGVFQTMVLPIIQKVAETHPRFASDMAHIALNRKWYFLPVELNKLPSQAIGVSFSDADLQQMALQNLNAVWINSKLFDASASDEDRGMLVLHEIIMGIRLMKYKNALDNCYSEVALQGITDPKKHSKSRDTCAATYAFGKSDALVPGINKIQLSKDDYDNIRELGLELWQNRGEISEVQLDAWMQDKQFRKY